MPACYREPAMSETQLSVLDVVATSTRPTGGRLVVLTPHWSGEAIALPPIAGQLAAAGERPVVFVVLAATAEVEEHLRQLAESENRVVNRQIVVVRARDWSTAIDAVRRDGDVIVFPSSDPSLSPTPSTARAQMAPAAPPQADPEGRLQRLAAAVVEWAGPLLIVAAFFLVQVQLDQAVTGPLHHALVAGTVIIEIAVLWRWEQWFSGRLRS
jgi:hypothetical protein